MTNSAAVSSDLQEKGTDDVKDGFKDDNHGSSSGTKTLNLGVQTVTSRGDTDQTAVKNEKRSRKDSDKKYNLKKKSKLQHYSEVCIELEKKNQECENLRNELENKNQECENLRKLEESKDQEARKDARRIENLDSIVSSMMRDRDFQNQQIQTLSFMLQGAQDELQREREYSRLMIQQQPTTQQDDDRVIRNFVSQVMQSD